MPGYSVGIKAQGTRIVLEISADSESSRTWEPKDSLWFFAFVSVLPPPWTLLHTSPAHIAAKAVRLPRCVLGGTPFRRSPDPRGRKKRSEEGRRGEKKEEEEGRERRRRKRRRNRRGRRRRKRRKKFQLLKCRTSAVEKVYGTRGMQLYSNLNISKEKRSPAEPLLVHFANVLMGL